MRRRVLSSMLGVCSYDMESPSIIRGWLNAQINGEVRQPQLISARKCFNWIPVWLTVDSPRKDRNKHWSWDRNTATQSWTWSWHLPWREPSKQQISSLKATRHPLLCYPVWLKYWAKCVTSLEASTTRKRDIRTWTSVCSAEERQTGNWISSLSRKERQSSARQLTTYHLSKKH